MRTKRVLFFLSIMVMASVMLGFGGRHKRPRRETIFDKVVSIPKELVFDIPKLPPLCDEISDLKKGFIDILDGKLYYEEEGAGVPLVLVPGGPGETHHHFHPSFSRAKEYARIIYYDPRGTGKSGKDDSGKTYTTKQAVEDLESLRKALKIEKWVMLCWSYGGFLGQCYALTYPERVKGLILVASGDRLTKVKMKPGRTKDFISEEEQAAIHKVYLVKEEGKLTSAQAIYNAFLAGDWKRQYYYKPTHKELIRFVLYSYPPAPGYHSLMNSDYKKFSLDGKFDDFEAPTLIVEGKWDLTWNTDKVGFMRKNHPHAQVEVFKRSGHKIFADEPKKFFNLLQKFLEKADKTQIVAYKPGNRLTWPKAHTPFKAKMAIAKDWPDKQESEKRILFLYDEAVKEERADDTEWMALFKYFFRTKKQYDKCLYALNQYEITAKKSNSEFLQNLGHCIKVLRGQILDLLGKRDEAIKCYREVLHNFKEKSDYCRYADRKWLEERLKAPFKWD